MWKTRVRLTSMSPYSQSRPHCESKLEKETPDAHEARTWHMRIHQHKLTGEVVMPAMAVRNCLAEAAKFLSMQIPGKGKATYTKHFESGIMVSADIPLFAHNGEPIVPPTEEGLRLVKAKAPLNTKAVEDDKFYVPGLNEVYGDWVFVPADGVPGSGKRVWKCYPVIQAWTAETEIVVMDETITKDVLMHVLRESGQLIGVGRFRVRNRGTYGRFEVAEI